MYTLPQELKAKLYKEFDFTLEFNDKNALFHPLEAGRFFLNPVPPFKAGSVELYVNKALKSKAELIVLLLPCDTSTEWFHAIWDKHKANPDKVNIRFLKRIKYEGEGSRFKFRIPSVLVILRNA